MWGLTVYPFPNVNGAADEIGVWINDFMPPFILDVIALYTGIKGNPCQLKGDLVMYKRIDRWAGWSSIQLMTCRLFNTKPLPELLLTYC